MTSYSTVSSILVDASNFGYLQSTIASQIAGASFIGLDIETQNSRATPGIKSMNKGKKVVFDINRMDLCGLSIYCEGSPDAYYFNLGHADALARVSWEDVALLLAQKRSEARWVCHNAAFERAVLEKTVGWKLENYICTMQMAVSAFGPDEYKIEDFVAQGLGEMASLLPAIRRVSAAQIESSDMQEVLSKIIAKQSDAAHSYNGWVREFAYGYNLKKCVKSFFDYNMTTYEQVLRGRDHMGLLTGAEVVSYGCDDAIWCVRLFHALLKFMVETNPEVISTFFDQELSMVEIYAQTWAHGVKINPGAVRQSEAANRVRFAECTRRLKAALRHCLPFPTELHSDLLESEDWYRKNGHNYRAKLKAWLSSPDDPDDFRQAWQVRGSIPNEWAAAIGQPENKAGLNLGHYMPMRVIMYDLFRTKPIMEQGKVQSDADSRGRLIERLRKQGNEQAVECLLILGEIASIEQASKLYIAPYQKLVDPDTGMLHPQVSSELATRRLSMANPNPQQLAKRGDSVYVRGYYEADHDDHVIVSLDWSQVELVTAAEFSQDEEFLKVYRQLPYKDLHELTSAGILDVPLEAFQALRDPSVTDHPPHILINTKGEQMAPASAYKYWRTEIGKGGNFESLYGLLLNTVGTRMGWDRDRVVEMTDRHKATYPRFWQWKAEVTEQVRDQGFVRLADHHRRVRFEATPEWAHLFRSKWEMAAGDDDSVRWFIEKVIRRIQTRAGNQAINAQIQGICAAIAKRSVIRILRRFNELGWGAREARFMFAVHDELVFSVHRNLVTEAIGHASTIMCDHPDIFKSVVLDCSPSVGLNFAPWDAKKARLGQLELREFPDLPFTPAGGVGKPLPIELWPTAVDWLFAERAGLNG